MKYVDNFLGKFSLVQHGGLIFLFREPAKSRGIRNGKLKYVEKKVFQVGPNFLLALLKHSLLHIRKESLAVKL